jgi:hypothetical protein
VSFAVSQTGAWIPPSDRKAESTGESPHPRNKIFPGAGFSSHIKRPLGLKRNSPIRLYQIAEIGHEGR